MFLVNAGDMISTYFFTPTLEYEANYWVKYFKLGWTGLILVCLFYLVVYAIFVYYYTDVFKQPSYQYRKGNSFLNIVEVYFFHDIRNKSFLIRLKNSFKSLCNYAGYYLFWYYSVGKILAIIPNFALGILLKKSEINEIFEMDF
jgi:hypothetical protein